MRTAARIPFEFPVVETDTLFSYQRVAAEAVRLRQLGMSTPTIARALRVTEKTVTKAVRCVSRGLVS
ncbi:MAG: helix-turn-helix domain-containing protein [Candidatus Binatia bacterium]